MAQLEWAVVCDHAYFDRTQQLCLVSILRELPAPQLPMVLPHLMFVGKLTDVRVVEHFEVAVGVTTPDGAVLCAAADSDSIGIELVREYVVVTLRGLPFTQEGVYSFRMQIGERAPVVIDVPVRAGEPHQHDARVH